MHPHKLILFKKEGCQPCENALRHLKMTLDEHPELEHYISVLQKENHPSLVEAYKLKLYPTLICLDSDGDEISRKVGQKYIDHYFFTRALKRIHQHRNYETSF